MKHEAEWLQNSDVEADGEPDDMDDMCMLDDDPQVWHDYLSGELSSFWMACQDFLKSNGLPVLDRCTYPEFVQFCYDKSSKKIPPVQ